MINSNIFPGDMLTKNFGVTKQNRVVFYDYDEITLMDKINFRKIPKPQNSEQEMSSEPWYYVAYNDVFYGGLSLHHLTQPNEGFIEESKLSLRTTIHGGAKINTNPDAVRVCPGILKCEF